MQISRVGLIIGYGGAYLLSQLLMGLSHEVPVSLLVSAWPGQHSVTCLRGREREKKKRKRKKKRRKRRKREGEGDDDDDNDDGMENETCEFFFFELRGT